MVLIIQHIHQVGIEWVNIVQYWELVQNHCKLVMIGLRSKLDFPNIKPPNLCHRLSSVNNWGRKNQHRQIMRKDELKTFKYY